MLPKRFSLSAAKCATVNVDANLQQLDMNEWPFDDGQFDAMIALNVVYHATCSEIETILAQIHRVLRPQGLLFITFKSVLDSQCGQGDKLASLTWAPTSGVEAGIPHYYVDETEAKRTPPRTLGYPGQKIPLKSAVNHIFERPGHCRQMRYNYHVSATTNHWY